MNVSEIIIEGVSIIVSSEFELNHYGIPQQILLFVAEEYTYPA